jgi:hypothetical protein
VRGCPTRPRIQATPTCSLRVSGVITAPKITCALAQSAIARAAIVATTRPQSPSLLLIALSGDCGAERNDHRRRAVSGPRASAPCRVKGAIAALCVGGPRSPAVRKRSDGGAGRPRARVNAHPPALNAHCGSLIVRIGIRLRLYGNSRPVAAMPSPLMNIWDATSKEKARRPCGYRRLAGRWSGRWRGVAVPHHVQRSHRCPRHRPEARTSRAAPAPRSGYPIQIVSNRLLARIFVTGNTFTES